MRHGVPNTPRPIRHNVRRVSDPSDVTTSLMAPLEPHVIVLFGATGDLARRKLLPGLLHLHRPACCPSAASSARRSTTSTTRRSANLARSRPATSSPAARSPTSSGTTFAADPALRPTGRRRRRAAPRPSSGREDELGGDAPPPPLPERAARRGARGRADARRGRPGRPVAHHHGEAVRHRPGERPVR